jgi:hypothetical protein
MWSQGIYVLQAYNYRISIERAKVIYEVTGKQFADRIIGWIPEKHFKTHHDASVLAATCVQFYVIQKYYPPQHDTDTEDDLKKYLTTFGDTKVLSIIEDKIPALVDDIISSVSGKRAKYELTYTLYIMKCHCMNHFSSLQRGETPCH